MLKRFSKKLVGAGFSLRKVGINIFATIKLWNQGNKFLKKFQIRILP